MNIAADPLVYCAARWPIRTTVVLTLGFVGMNSILDGIGAFFGWGIGWNWAHALVVALGFALLMTFSARRRASSMEGHGNKPESLGT
ncbi:MAG: hypothetical protein WD825_10610 [Gemmatimonadaceae bacterium]